MKKKVLLIRLSSLGDVVILTSVVELLSKEGHRVFIVTQEKYSEIFRDDKRVEQTFELSGKKGLFTLIRNLRKEKFDFAFDLHCKPTSFFILILSGARNKRFLKKRIFSRRLAVLFKKRIHEVPVKEIYASPIKISLGIRRETPHPRLCFHKMERTSKWGSYIVFAPGGKHPSKVWPHYIELAKKIIEETNFNIVLVGDKNDKNYFSFSGEERIINMIGKTTLRQLIGIIAESLLTISNDSGPAHIAGALSVPVFVFFGPTVPEFGFRPEGKMVKVFERRLSCRPCSLHGEKKCRRGDLECLRSISPDEVYHEFRKFLNEFGR